MEIINAHAHIYPNKIAKKATDTIGEFYSLDMQVEAGTPERLLESGLKSGVNKFVVHSCATKPHQVRAINEFIKEEINAHKEFIGFMTLHQDLTEEEMEQEIDWCMQEGFKGIKLHPDFQKFNIDDENFEKLYRILSKKDKVFPILFHTGDDRYEFSKPYRLANMAKKYKKVYFIAAHFGGYRCWNEIDVYKGLDNVYFDTCSALPFIGEEKAKEFINKFGVEKFFFGDDFPMWDIEEELKRFFKIKLTTTEQELILAKNIKNLLNIK
jgi:predicted TIM-barrel fold metal-dependent hydrolase